MTGVEATPRRALLWLVWILFIVASIRLGWNSDADDLTATYIAGRIVSHGGSASLYTPVIAAAHWRTVPVWAHTVAGAGLAEGTVTAYVQTPLWAWLAAPLANMVDFITFKRIFAGIGALMNVIMVARAVRQWAPRLIGPAWQAGLLAGLFCSVPFLWCVVLGQTHAIFLSLAVLAAIRAAHGKDISAGALLAAAAAVKITPLWVAVTWLAAGRWRPALSFAIFSGLFAALAIILAGWPVMASYLAVLHQLSGRVLLSFNNDALAALLLDRYTTDATAFHFQPVALPPWVAGLSFAALALCAVLGAWLDRRMPRKPGAVLTLVAATAFAPLAWNHYFIVLILPVMILLQAWRESGRVGWIFLTVLVAALNLPPLAYMVGAPLGIVTLRSHLLAALLCIGALAILGWMAPAPRSLAAEERPAAR